MNDPISKPTAGQPDASRRRFAKAGLAAPVVLATLASKPVLGASFWNCTVSGQLSGNVSSHDSVACNTLGTSQSNWVANLSGDTRTLANLGVPDYYHIVTGLITDNTVGNAATLLEILSISSEGSPPPPNLPYGQKALVLLLNAYPYVDHSGYPLSRSEAQNLFIAAVTGGGYTDVDPNVIWTNTEVKNFIDLLWH